MIKKSRLEKFLTSKHNRRALNNRQLSIALIGNVHCLERRKLYSHATQKYVIASSNLNKDQYEHSFRYNLAKQLQTRHEWDQSFWVPVRKKIRPGPGTTLLISSCRSFPVRARIQLFVSVGFATDDITHIIRLKNEAWHL